MKQAVATILTAIALFTAAPSAAHAGSAGSRWPVASAPLPAGAIQSQSGSRAQVLANGDVGTALDALDAKYRALGYTIGVSSGIPRWYRRSGSQITVFYAWWDATHSYFTLRRG